MSMNLEVEYDRCIKTGNKIYNDTKAVKNLCSFFQTKLNMCKMECMTEENARQQAIVQKCLPNSTTDSQLDECVKKQLMESSLKVCRMKCELKAVENYRNI